MPMVLIPGLVTIQPPTLQQLPSEQSAADHTDNDAPRGACDGGASERGVGRRGPHGARVDAPPALDAADDDSTPASNTAPDQTAVFDVGNDAAASNSAQSAAAAPPASARRAFASTQAARALERAVQDVTPREGDRANNVETKAANTPRLSDALNQAGARISAPTTSTTPQTAPETAAPQSASSTLQSFAQGGGSTNNGSGSNASRDDRSADPQAIAAAAKADHHDATTTTRTVDVHVNPAATSHVTTDAPVASGASGPIPDETMTQIVQQVRLQWRDGIGDARIMLDPDYLGGVNISLRVEAGAVTATVNADSAAVRTWIESNEGMLRQGLAEHGLTLERLVIAGEKTDTPRDARQSNERGREEQPRRERRQPQKPTELFELTV
jgi:flagellar hook-length control protein FliK